jgi:hypothetical protein
MKIFISHSSARSRELAKQMEWFLRMLLPSTEPWVSTGIDKGADWGHEIGQSLQEAAAGVVCLTQENLNERWILFEAGALAKQFGTKVCTLLLDVKEEEVKPPLSKFQHTKAEREEVMKLVESINKVAMTASHNKGRPLADLKEAFDLLWPKLEATITKLREQGPPVATAAPQRTAEDMMAEVLTTVRELAHQQVVLYNRQEKALLLSKAQYEAVVGHEAPSLRALRNAAQHATTLTTPIMTSEEAKSLLALLRASDSLNVKVEEHVKGMDLGIKQPKATETDS